MPSVCHTRHRPQWSAGCVALAGLALAACSSPLAGSWQGTLDLGPVDAWPIGLTVDEDGSRARVHVKEKGRAFQDFQSCSLTLTDRYVELVYDAGRPNCDVDSPDASERRTLRGTVGEGVVFGEVVRGTTRLGFFRAFLDTGSVRGVVVLPGETTATVL